MALDPDFVSILICPESSVKLQIASPKVVTTLNERIATGTVTTRSGTTLTQALESALITVDGRRIFQVIDHIPNLLIDDAIELPNI